MRKFKIAEALTLLALVLVVFVAWGIARDRLAPGNWKTPVEYNGDALEFIAWIKVASEGDFIPFVREGGYRLDAPYHATWEDYPTAEKFLICFLGIVAKMFGLFQASNFGLVFVHILSAISFYVVCRLLRHDRIWSLVGAALFSLTYYNFYRNLGGLHLACSYTLPFAILTCWLVLASKHMRPGDRWAWICLITGLVMGLSAPYNMGMFVQLLCFSILGQFFQKRRRENLVIGGLTLGMVVLGFVAINAHTLLYQWAHGKNTYALARSYLEAELYALKPIEFIIPPLTHHSAALANIGAYYMSSAYVRGEMFSPYLGLVVIAGAVWVFAEIFLRLVRQRSQPRRFPPYGPQILWVIAYAIIGGVNCILALCGFQLFRATVRYSIFVSLLVLLFGVARMSVLSRRWTFGMKLGLALTILFVGLYDQLPRQLAPEQVGAVHAMIASDQAFGARLDEKLPPGGMVFEMPVMVFPEALPIRGVQGYEMLRPYFFTKTARFTYGAIRGRPREDWQWEVEKLPAPQLISQLENYGFSAIYLNRKCYADHGADLVAQFAAAGRAQVIEDDLHEQVCVLLNPSAHPELPHTDDRALINYKRGWAIKEHSPSESRQWSGGDATLTFFSEDKQPASYSFKCLVGSISARHVTIQMKGRELWTGEIPAGQAAPVDISLTGWPGNNTIELLTDQPPVRPNETSPLVAFTLINLQITRASGN